MFKLLITIPLTLISFWAVADSKRDISQELFWRDTSTRFTEQQSRMYLREVIQQLKDKSRELVEQVKNDATAEEIEELKSIYSNSTPFEDHIEHGVDTIFSAELLQGYLDRFSYDELLAFKKFFNSESYGIAASGFGFVFGSVFCLETVIHPLWVLPLQAPLPVLVVPLVAGAVLLTLGLLIALLEAWWQQRLGHWARDDASDDSTRIGHHQVRALRRRDEAKRDGVSSQTPAIAKVGAHIIETINKKPLDLRDRKVLVRWFAQE